VSRVQFALQLQNVISAISRLEFAFTQLEIQLDNLLSGIQGLLAGRITIPLVPFSTLLQIVNNVTLQLPLGFSLLGGNQPLWYYRYAKATLLADFHGFALAIKMPLVMPNRKYEVFRVITFPRRVQNHTYEIYQLGESYLAVSYPHFTYRTVTQAELDACDGDDTKYCSANQAVSDARSGNCLVKLFLCDPKVPTDCPKMFTTTTPLPRMERQAAAVMYFFPHLTNVHIKCHRNQWTTDSLQLIGAGILSDVRPCHISAGSLQLFAEITDQSGIESDTPLIIFPSPVLEGRSGIETHTQPVRHLQAGNPDNSCFRTPSGNKCHSSL
jgi:hypothetical protein